MKFCVTNESAKSIVKKYFASKKYIDELEDIEEQYAAYQDYLDAFDYVLNYASVNGISEDVLFDVKYARKDVVSTINMLRSLYRALTDEDYCEAMFEEVCEEWLL